MTAAEMYKILDAIDQRLAKQDKLISILEDQLRSLYQQVQKVNK